MIYLNRYQYVESHDSCNFIEFWRIVAVIEYSTLHFEEFPFREITLDKLGRHIETLASCEKVITNNPNYPDAWFNRGVALGYLGDHSESFASFDKTIEINPNIGDKWTDNEW